MYAARDYYSGYPAWFDIDDSECESCKYRFKCGEANRCFVEEPIC